MPKHAPRSATARASRDAKRGEERSKRGRLQPVLNIGDFVACQCDLPRGEMEGGNASRKQIPAYPSESGGLQLAGE